MYNAKFVSLVKISGTAKLVQGVKYGQVPAGAVAGGNGSFIVGERAKLILRVRCENGGCVEKDIYFDVKSYTKRRITDNFCRQLEGMLADFNFLVENGRIVNLDAAFSNLV